MSPKSVFTRLSSAAQPCRGQVPMDEAPEQEVEVTSSKLKPTRTEVPKKISFDSLLSLF